MFFRLSRQSKVDRILLVSLSNLGDIVMTFPVFDALRETFPSAEISIIVGPKGEGLFSTNPYVQKTIVFHKSLPWREKWRWFMELRRQRFDLVVDLRNSMLPFLLNARCVTRPVFTKTRSHMKDKHLRRLSLVIDDVAVPKEKYAGFLSQAELNKAEAKVNGGEDFVLVAPGAADRKKRWGEEGYAELIRQLVEKRVCLVVVVGDQRDRPAVDRILKNIHGRIVNLCGLTTLPELIGVIRRAGLAVTNDSGIMHLVSYFDVPTVALFGPTDPFFYGPWSSQKSVLRKSTSITDITVPDVLAAIDKHLSRRKT